jgi:glycopeptide antibiotics resistance protein
MSGAGSRGVELIGSRRVAGTLLVAYLVVVSFIVFSPTADVPTESVSRLWALAQRLGSPDWITPTVVEFATNVALFVPLSLLGATFWPQWRWWTWLLVGLGLTITIEFGQMFLLPGRSAALVDVVANTLGALLGYLLVVTVRRL